MATNYRIFTSFAIEDSNLRTLLTGQAKNDRVPFEFVDYSVKSAWDTSWKTNCRTRLRGCDGVIGIVTRNTPNADGQIWEINCAIDEKIPVLLIYGNSNDRGMLLPAPINRLPIQDWSWSTIKTFIDRL